MYIREIYLKKIRPYYDSNLIKVITGIRRCGKSVLITQIKEEIQKSGVLPTHIIYFNFEDLEMVSIKNELDLHDKIKSLVKDNEKYYLFFDEIQNVQNFQKAVASFKATLNVSIFITGSNSHLLSGELATLLTGRTVSFRILPFTYKEVVDFKKQLQQPVNEETFINYLKWGGFPQRFDNNQEAAIRTYLQDIFNSIIFKDIVYRGKIQDIDLLNRIIDYIIQNSSKTFSGKSISDYLSSNGRKVYKETVYNYVDLMISSFIIDKVSRYDVKGKKLLATLEKYYMADLGLRTLRNSGFSIEYGQYLENVIYSELIARDYQVYIGKTYHGEVDFIAIKDGKKIYIQVAYLLSDSQIVEREFGAFNYIKDNHPKYVISMDKFDFSRDGIIHLNIVQGFLLSDKF